MNSKEFLEKKREILEKAIPHLLHPEVYPMPKLSLDECAVFLAKSVNDIPARSFLVRTEREALFKMRDSLERKGIGGVSDFASA